MDNAKTPSNDKLSRREIIKAGVATAFSASAFSATLLKGETASAALQIASGSVANPLNWPALTAQTHPWAFNWWHGSAVDKENLARELARYREGGLGGIHIIPIYGTTGAEARDIEYLSPQWMEMLAFTVAEAKRLGMGVDMTTGSGWCFGGPNLRREDGGWHLQTQVSSVPAGARATQTFNRDQLQMLTAVSDAGQKIDLKARLDAAGNLDFEPGNQGWKLYAVSARPDGPAVKRAAPGGAGPMINPFSPSAISRFLERFTAAFATYNGPLPRSMYHDSYEYNSNWSPELGAAFAKRRGYALDGQLAALAADASDTSEMARRVRCDYNETLSDLMVEEVFPQWTRWCRSRGMLTRNQAHGSAGNLLDLYALADMPETEMFGRGTRDPLASGFDARFAEGDRNPLISKFASSAAHVAGHPLVTAETGTWMAEHFCETLEELKCLIDLLWLSGINHVVYHGTCYSPDDAPWPGWVFYASTEMNPRNPIWHDSPALSTYIARAQSMLQGTQPSNDVLLYWPIHDFWQSDPRLAPMFTVHAHAWLEEQPVGKVALQLWNRGYGFDYLSDRQLAAATTQNGAIAVPGGTYRVILVPSTQVLSLPTLQKLFDLARQGATVLFQDHLPADVPGAGNLAARRAALKALTSQLTFVSKSAGSQSVFSKVPVAKWGRGQILVGEVEAMLSAAKVARESVVDQPGVKFIRKATSDGWCYFIANQGTQFLDGDVTLGTPARSAVVMNPMTGQIGAARLSTDAAGQTRAHLRLEPGHSLLLRTFRRARATAPQYIFEAPNSSSLAIEGPWNVRFIAGGPQLPAPFQTPTPVSWTKNGDPATQSFSGTAIYSTTFDAPVGAGSYLLDLGEVRNSARVRINGIEQGTVFMHPYRLFVSGLKPTGNLLEVEVTNLGANRIRDLDRRGVNWRVFRDINVVNIAYKPFNASDWPVFDSGLLGPVMLLRQQ